MGSLRLMEDILESNSSEKISVDWYGMFGVCVEMWPPTFSSFGFRRDMKRTAITGLDSGYNSSCAESKEVSLHHEAGEQRASPLRPREERGDVST